MGADPRLKCMIPLAEIEQEAQQQIQKALRHDFLKKLVIMPDVHAGYSLPIGGVALLEGKISPTYVGYDIGCGMCYLDTQLPVRELLPTDKDKQRLFERIYQRIPVGLGEHRQQGLDYAPFQSQLGDPAFLKLINQRLPFHLGTLGSGNHFIEIGQTRQKTLALTLHSGSRGVGYAIAERYMAEGEFFDLSSDLGQNYLADMNFALEYALANRCWMMEELLDLLGLNAQQHLGRMVNENHNHALLTPEGVLHRKGATPAELDQLGIIPANMKDGVYLTKGLGNPEYLSSASHGAGRRMSRQKAKKTIELAQFKEQMKGIVAKVDHQTLDEAPQAYKRIDAVLGPQQGMVVEVVDIIRPLINIKG